MECVLEKERMAKKEAFSHFCQPNVETVESNTQNILYIL